MNRGEQINSVGEEHVKTINLNTVVLYFSCTRMCAIDVYIWRLVNNLITGELKTPSEHIFFFVNLRITNMRLYNGCFRIPRKTIYLLLVSILHYPSWYPNDPIPVLAQWLLPFISSKYEVTWYTPQWTYPLVPSYDSMVLKLYPFHAFPPFLHFPLFIPPLPSPHLPPSSPFSSLYLPCSPPFYLPHFPFPCASSHPSNFLLNYRSSLSVSPPPLTVPSPPLFPSPNCSLPLL